MSKKFSTELYTTDCSYIERLHSICQKANLVVLILEILSVLGMIASEFFYEENFILVPVIIAVAVILFFLNKIILNVVFGLFYDIRVTRMSVTAPVAQEKKED